MQTTGAGPTGRGYAVSVEASSPGKSSIRRRTRTATWVFAGILVYALLDYGRPMDMIEPLGVVRPLLLATIWIAAALAMYYERVPWTSSRFLLCGLLVVLMTIWVPLAANNGRAYQTLYTTSQTLLFCAALASFVDTPARLAKFLNWWLCAFVVQGLWALSHAGHGTGDFARDENDVAALMCIGIPFAYFYARRRQPLAKSLFYWGMLAILLSAVVASQSRGGFVGLVAVGAGIFALGKRKLRNLAVTVTVAGLLFALAPSSYWNEIATISNRDDSTRQERIVTWQILGRAFLHNPVFGLGQGNTPHALAKYQKPGEYKRGLAGRMAHSVYFTVLPELGSCGVLIFGGLLFLHFRDMLWVVRRPPPTLPLLDETARALLCATVAWLACGLFLSLLWYPHLYYLLALGYVVRRLARQRVESAPPRPARVRADSASPVASPSPEAARTSAGLAEHLLRRRAVSPVPGRGDGDR